MVRCVALRAERVGGMLGERSRTGLGRPGGEGAPRERLNEVMGGAFLKGLACAVGESVRMSRSMSV